MLSYALFLNANVVPSNALFLNGDVDVSTAQFPEVFAPLFLPMRKVYTKQ